MLQKTEQAGGLGIVGLRRTMVLHRMAREDSCQRLSFVFKDKKEAVWLGCRE